MSMLRTFFEIGMDKSLFEDLYIFKNKELGGLQDFVKEVLQENELFNLKKGLESTPNQNRKYEFTIETSKEGRRPDYVIFIDGINIVIPVEVERFENIKNGNGQLNKPSECNQNIRKEIFTKYRKNGYKEIDKMYKKEIGTLKYKMLSIRYKFLKY